MSRLYKLFQQRSNLAFEKYLVESRKPREPDAEHLKQVICATLKVESDTWAKAAEWIKKEELNK